MPEGQEKLQKVHSLPCQVLRLHELLFLNSGLLLIQSHFLFRFRLEFHLPAEYDAPGRGQYHQTLLYGSIHIFHLHSESCPAHAADS